MAAPSLGQDASLSFVVNGIVHGAWGKTAGSGQKLEVIDQTSEVRGKADL
jgi:hypothetical protein